MLCKKDNPQNYNFTGDAKKHIFKKLSFLLQLKYLSCQNNDNGNMILIAQIINLQYRGRFIGNLFFACTVKLISCGLSPLTK